ncbi:mannose-6-phosphate isomerase-like protein (cupin superfamily) [Bacilli bacterium PM5-9]|nr:mannose-6-phosphate isomerase-like protein (cupin superfamily) [Bacilli bacterium PM5-9]
MQVYEVLTTKDLKEIIKHGSKSFPLAIYKTLLSRNKLGYVQLHWHNEIQFVLVTKGTINFIVDSTSNIIEENNGIFINSNHLHSARSFQCNDSEYICIDVNANLFINNENNIINKKYLEPFISAKSIPAISLNRDIQWQQDILNDFEILYLLYEEKKFGYELKMQSIILNILHNMIINSE